MTYSNSARKRQEAFMHNQQRDYEDWLRKNTSDQIRCKIGDRISGSQKHIMLTLQAALAMSAMNLPINRGNK